MTTCTVAGCETPATRTRRTLCERHYYRLRRTGSTEATHPQRAAREPCRIEGCPHLDAGPHGYCAKHHTRIQRHGDPHTVKRNPGLSGDRNPAWRGDSIGSNAAHLRVTAARGAPASAHACVDCGGQAAHWSYNHGDPNAKPSDRGPFSTSPQYYDARCVPCHKRYDLARR